MHQQFLSFAVHAECNSSDSIKKANRNSISFVLILDDFLKIKSAVVSSSFESIENTLSNTSDNLYCFFLFS